MAKKLDPNYTLNGRITDLKDQPLAGLTVRAYDQDPKTPDNPLGQETVTNADGSYTINFTEADFKIGGKESGGPDVFICVYGEGDLLEKSPVQRNAKNKITIGLQLDFVPSDDKNKRDLEGRIILDRGLPANKLKLRLYSYAFGGTPIRVGEATTGDDGSYKLTYKLRTQAARLEVRAVDANEKEIVLSRPLNDFGDNSLGKLNLIAPGALQPLAAEYQRLTDDLKPYVGEMRNLAGVKENGNVQDLTVLNRATGWDARLIALAAITERLSADPEINLPQKEVYGLLRAGLPSDKLMLARVDADVAEQALKTVRDAGIVELNDQQIGQFKQQFAAFSNKLRLEVPAPGSRSTYGDLLKASGLPDDAQARFAPVYLSYRGEAAQLWDEARKVGLDDTQIGKLQLQGKLAFLAGNSEVITSRLLQKRINDPAQLVEKDFHRADMWVKELFDQTAIPENRWNNLTDADRKKLDALIPTAYAGEKVEDRFNAYAEDMARKVRLSYPTQVINRIIEQDVADPFRLSGSRVGTATLLKKAATEGFRLGQTPVESFFKTHAGVNATAEDLNVMKTLQRVYQITPSNEAMPVLMSLGMTSAYDVMAHSEADFMVLYADKYFGTYGKMPAQAESQLIHRKATQVSSMAYNLFTIAKTMQSSPPVQAMSASVEVRESVRNELIKHFPTMESLFGSMDFCECEHCRSVLSPAAYLVNLLQFIDDEYGEPAAWGNFLTRWEGTHNSQKYTDKYKPPYDALIERRPDLPHIPLTCENTHTALPYIDIVNEIMEYFVANGKLEEKAAHDTGEATTGELLAEPQNVIRGAYDKLREARYPLNLPFDLWIETGRQFCDYFETPLARVLEVFRQSDDLFAPKQSFDRSSIFMESLGLSPAELAIFTDPDPLKLGKWHELFGYPRAEISGPTNVINATVNVPNRIAALFTAEDKCNFYDATTGTLQNEEKEISGIGAIDSGGEGKALITFVGIWTTPPKAGDVLVLAKVPDMLSSAKTLSRRLGITYKEMVEITKALFVNSKLAELGILYKLGVTVQEVLFYRGHKPFYEQNKDLLGKERSTLTPADQQRFDALFVKVPITQRSGWEDLTEVDAFEMRLKDVSETFKGYGFDASVWLNTALQNNTFDTILVLADPDAGCDFDATTLRYANGNAADDIAFLRINLFVRLWRKLGWPIEEIDRALLTFVPKNAPFDQANLNKEPLKTALIYLAHLKMLDEKVKVGKQSRLKFLTLWSDIAASGKKPLYAQLFLTRGVLKSDDVFDHPLGRYLSAAGIATIAQSRWHQAQAPDVALADKIDPVAFAAEPKVRLSYDELQEVQYLAFEGVLTNAEKAALTALSPSPALPGLLDAVQVKATEFMLIKGHLLALQGALSLTADEITRILEDSNKTIETAELSLPNVSLLYRYGLLARGLKLSVRKFIALKQLSGLDPFMPLHPDPLADTAAGVVPSKKAIDFDYPFIHSLRFVEVAEQVKESGLKIEDLEYLLRHRDETGKYRLNREGALALLKMLAEGICAIRAEHTTPDDPGAISEEVLRQKLGLALLPDVVERFLAMMNGAAEFTATRSGVAPINQLALEEFADEPAIREVRYNATRQEQKLTFRGVLFDAQKTDLQTRLALALTGQQQLVFAELLDSVKNRTREFFDNHLKKQKLRLDGEAGFLEDNDFDALFLPLKPLKKILPIDTPQEINQKLQENVALQQENQSTLQQRRYRIAKAFLPFLQQRLTRQFVVQTLIAQTGADPALMESLLTDTRLLGEVQPDGGTRPLLDVLSATAERGLTATFFASIDGTGAALTTVSLVDANTALKDKNGNPLKPAGANSARLEGYLEAPVPGAYRFYVVLGKQNAEAELLFAHLTKPTLTGTANNDGDEIGHGPDEYAELKPGIPYRFTLDLHKLNGGEAQLLVQGETLPKDKLSQFTLYPATAMDGAEHAIGLLAKALHLLQSLGLSEREARYLLTHTQAGEFENLDLKNLPTQASNDSPAGAQALFAQFLRLVGYTRLKRDLADGTDDLIGIFEANETTDPDKMDKQVYPLIAKLTRREKVTVKSTAKALFGENPVFANEKPLLRLWEALQVVEQFGVLVASVLDWTRFVSPAATPEQRFEIARDLKEAIKARFEPESWQRVAQPIFDKLRQRQRDALVAHVMHQHGFARLEQLYEYFLIDPGMEPVVQTSRIRLAIASVQLFIQRCLLNLEKDVHPSAIINARQWEWMKRYRVWEANRKIFLFPENWLEPEFRDDKTHLFVELEGALLQGDVSSDLVEDAFLNYLKKLEELARLDVVAMHIEDNVDPAQNTLHVFGRTYSQPHKYFYRRYAHQMWTPWEPVTAEIEGDHLAPVIWRDRLYLFWVTFMDKPLENAQTGSRTAGSNLASANVSDLISDIKAAGTSKQIDVQLHWSEYLQGEWSTQESSQFVPVGYHLPNEEYNIRVAAGELPLIGKVSAETRLVFVPVIVAINYHPGLVFIHVSKDDGEEGGVYIHLEGPDDFQHSFYLAGRNSTPERTNYSAKPDSPYNASFHRATRYSGGGPLTVRFQQRITTEPGKSPNEEPLNILRQGRQYMLLPGNNKMTVLGVSEDAYRDASDPNAVKEAIQRGLAEIEKLIKPVFYQDNTHTLFIEPNVTERTIEEWQEWVTRTPQPESSWEKSGWWKEIVVLPEIPWTRPFPDPRGPIEGLLIDPGSLINPIPDYDWLVNPGTGLLFEGVLIGPAGRMDLEIVTAEAAGLKRENTLPVNVNSGSGLATGSTVVLTGAAALEQAGLTHVSGGLNIIGSAGFNSMLAQNFKESNRSGFSAGMPRTGLVER